MTNNPWTTGPEPSAEPREEKSMTVSCGHEVYTGETVYEWEDREICERCMRDKRDELRLEEFADLVGAAYRTVGRIT